MGHISEKWVYLHAGLLYDLFLNWPSVWRLNFKHSGLVEERLLWNIFDDYDPNFRFRYRLKTKVLVNKQSITYKALYVPLSYEIFGNAGKEEIELFRNQA